MKDIRISQTEQTAVETETEQMLVEYFMPDSCVSIHLKFIYVFINIFKFFLIGVSDFFVYISTEHFYKKFHADIRIKEGTAVEADSEDNIRVLGQQRAPLVCDDHNTGAYVLCHLYCHFIQLGISGKAVDNNAVLFFNVT